MISSKISLMPFNPSTLHSAFPIPKKGMSNLKEGVEFGACYVDVDDIEVESVIDDEHTVSSADHAVEEAVVHDDLAYIAQFDDFVTNEVAIDAINFEAVATGLCTDSDTESDAEDDEVNIEKLDEKQDEGASSDSDSESDGEFERLLREKSKMIQAKAIECDEEAETVPSGPPRTKHEVVENLSATDFPKAIDVGKEKMELVGEVMYRIEEENAIVVQANIASVPLNEGSLLCNQNGIVLGPIHEVFGPVVTPYYIVRYRFHNNDKGQLKRDNRNGQKSKNNKKLISPESPSKADESNSSEPPSTHEETQMKISPEPECKTNIEVKEASNSTDKTVIDIAKIFKNKTPIFTIPDHANYLTNSVLQTLKVKGSDASNIYDEEVGN
jgi:rRNA processing protein Gar1